MSARVVAIALSLAVACQRADPPPPPPAPPHAVTPTDLREQLLAPLAGAAPADVSRAIAHWRLDEPAFDRTVITAYRGLYADYVAAFDAAAPAIAAQLAHGGTIATRRHWGGDRALVNGQARTRWAVPTMFPSAVAELDGSPLPFVFVPDGQQWRALLGLDDVVVARARAWSTSCADLLVLAGPPGHCSDAGWMIADGAVRGDRAAFDHGCQLAANLCR